MNSATQLADSNSVRLVLVISFTLAQVTFTADSDTYYPPGTVVSGYVNGKYFRGVVQGPGESESSRFNKRVKSLEARINAEEARRGIPQSHSQSKKVQDILSRVKKLESKMSTAFHQTRSGPRPTKLSGNVAGFHFHGTLEPASKVEAEEKQAAPMELKQQLASQKSLLKRVTSLEAEVGNDK
mmetsp:Transcript_5410/g.11939  ORF Transcript_5410/g.11939 Transcript_5410/m.11939 type:complete len:183 (+) Transcript_5410:1-549(+)